LQDVSLPVLQNVVRNSSFFLPMHFRRRCHDYWTSVRTY
jgi:hypothetical protein